MSHGRSRLRIGGGEWRGRPLRVGAVSRPTEARVRAALFSIWQDRLAGSRFLDLFAGSGAVGLEALSRGAAHSCFVEHDPKALAALRRNALELLGEHIDSSRVTILRRRLPADLSGAAGGPFDLAFADPPYAFAGYERLLASCSGLLQPGGELVVEHSKELSLDAGGGLEKVGSRRYGGTCLSFFVPASSPAS